jgi:hypothetical protein
VQGVEQISASVIRRKAAGYAPSRLSRLGR